MGFGAVHAERSALERTYTDRLTIHRAETQTVGAIDKVVPTVCCADVPCALSRKTDRSKQTDSHQTITYDCVVFVSPSLDVRAGDKAQVERLGRNDHYDVVGKPAIYETHQELYLKGRDLA